MKKNAARYASQPSIDIGRGGMGAQPGYADMNRFSSLFGVTPGSNFMQAAQAGQQNPNQARNLRTPPFDPATAQGVMTAAQKVADFSFMSGVGGNRNEALPDWLEGALDAVFGLGKYAEVSTGMGNAGGEVAQTGQDAQSQMPNRPGQVPVSGAAGAQVGGMNAQGAMQTGLGVGFAGLQRGNPIAAQVRANWAGLAPGTPAPFRKALPQKIAHLMSPGPAGLPPQGAAVQAQPPGPPGMPQPPQGAAPMGMPPGAPPPGGMMPPGGAPAGQPPGQPPGAPPGPPPPTAPMSDPPPMPLPANPRPAQPSPKSSVQAQHEADMLGLMEAKQRADMPMMAGDAQRDLQAQVFAADAKTAGDIVDDADYGDPRGDGRARRAWEWGQMNAAAQHDAGKWLPRYLSNRHTPLTELLSSPGKGGVLGGVLGAGLGGLAGGVGGHLAGLSPDVVGGLAAGGALGGGVLGGVKGYSGRRERNDAVMDALRHLPPGATVGDMENFRAPREKEGGLKTGFKKLAQNIAPDHPSAADLVRLSLLSGGAGALQGGALGGLLGTGAGAARGNVPEGLGRGILRGGLAGAGAGVGGLLGGLLTHRLGGGAPDLGALAGAGLGGLAGYAGGGALLGKPRDERDKEKEAALKSGFEKLAAIWDKQAMPGQPMRRPAQQPQPMPQQMMNPHAQALMGQLQSRMPLQGSREAAMLALLRQTQGGQHPVPPAEAAALNAIGSGKTAGFLKSATKRAADVVLDDGTNLGDHESLAEKLASGLYRAAKDNPTSRLLHDAMVDRMRKFAAQDSSKPQRSATGESEGLTYQHKPDHYVHGQEAWASADQYFHKRPKTPNPFTGRHSGENKSASFVKLAGIASGAAEFVDHSAAPLLAHAESGGWRGVMDAGKKILGYGEEELPKVLPKIEGAAPQATAHLGGAVPQATAQLNQAARPLSWRQGYFGHYDPSLAGKGWGMRNLPGQLPGMGFRGYMGGVTTGMILNPELSPEERAQQYRYGLFNPGNWNAAQWTGAGVSGLMGHQGIAGSRMGQFVQPMLQRGTTGGFAGGVADQVAGAFGADTHNLGARTGLGLGIASGLGSNRAYSTARQGLAESLNSKVSQGLMEPERAAYMLRMAETAAGQGEGVLGQAAANSWGGRLGAGLHQVERGSMAPFNWAGRQIASVPRRMLGYSAEEMAQGGANPESWLAPVNRWLGRAEQGLAHKPVPQGWQRGLYNAGRAGTLLPLGVAGIGVGSSLLGNAVTNKAKDVGAQMYNEAMPQMQSDMADFVDQYMQQRGMLNQQGQFNPLGGMFGQGGPLSGLSQGADSVLRSLGMDPSAMSGMQKAMILGGGMLGAGGMASGHPLAAVGGGLSMLGGLMPYLTPGQSQGGAPYGGQPSPYGGQQVGYQGVQAPPPAQQNEWQRQQQLNRPSG